MRSLIVLWPLLLAGCTGSAPPREHGLPPAPAGLEQRVSTYLKAAQKFERHPWRDLNPLNGDGTVNGYIEIPRGESTKWEFRIDLNRRDVDRVIPHELGGYPMNYGFLPQTISYDGDPADVLVLGPPLDGGAIVKGEIVGLMKMVDSGDLDSKVIASPLDTRGRALYRLESSDRERLERFFNTYKTHEGKTTKVTGWGGPAESRIFIDTTSGFFQHR